MKMYNKIRSIAKIITDDNIFVYAAQASFYIIISSIPFIMLLLSLARYLLPIDEFSFTSPILALVPEVIKPSLDTIIGELFDKASGRMISVTALTSFWSASRGIAAIERGVRNVYHTQARPAFFLDLLASFFYTVMFLAVIFLLLATAVFGTSIMHFLEVKSGILHRIFSKTSWLKWIVTFSLLTLFFAAIYTAFSGRKIHFKRHIPGAVFTTVMWIVFSVLFSFYIENFANYSYLYGSLTAIVLLMLWVYFCMIIFLAGAEINVTVLVVKLKQRSMNSQYDI